MGALVLSEPAVSLPAVTAAQMAEVDRIMVEDLGIALVQMMENAGRHLADLVLAGWQPERVVVLAGPGGNGGGGMVAARHLANRGIHAEVVLSDEARLKDVPARQRTILDAMGVPVHEAAGPGRPSRTCWRTPWSSTRCSAPPWTVTPANPPPG